MSQITCQIMQGGGLPSPTAPGMGSRGNRPQGFCLEQDKRKERELLDLTLAALVPPLAAQKVSLLLGGVHTEYADSITGNAGTVSLRLGGSAVKPIGVADASFTHFVDGGFVTQGSAYGTWLLTNPNWNGPTWSTPGAELESSYTILDLPIGLR